MTNEQIERRVAFLLNQIMLEESTEFKYILDQILIHGHFEKHEIPYATLKARELYEKREVY